MYKFKKFKFLRRFRDNVFGDVFWNKSVKRLQLKRDLWLRLKRNFYFFNWLRFIKLKRRGKGYWRQFPRIYWIYLNRRRKKRKEPFTFSYNITIPKRIYFKPFNYKWSEKVFIKKFRIFYGYLRYKKVKSLFYKRKNNKLVYNKSFFYNLEGSLLVFLYRLNLFSNVVLSKLFIKSNNIFINNILVNDFNYKIGFFDIISLKRTLHNSFYLSLYKRLRSFPKLVHQNCPMYVEFNYKIMSFIFFRKINIEDIRYPFKVISSKFANFS